MGHSSIWQSVLPGESRASSWTQQPHRRVMGPRRLHPFWWSNHLDPWETLLRCNKKQLQLRLAPGWVPLHSAFCLSMHLICLGSPTSQPKLERLQEMWHIPRRPSGESPDLQRDGVKELKVPRHRTDHPHDLGGWSAPEWASLTECCLSRAGKGQLYSHQMGHDPDHHDDDDHDDPDDHDDHDDHFCHVCHFCHFYHFYHDDHDDHDRHGHHHHHHHHHHRHHRHLHTRHWSMMKTACDGIRGRLWEQFEPIQCNVPTCCESGSMMWPCSNIWKVLTIGNVPMESFHGCRLGVSLNNNNNK